MQVTLAAASLTLTPLCITAEARDLGLGIVWHVTPDTRKILIGTYDEEYQHYSVSPDCKITLNGKPSELGRLLKWDRVMTQKFAGEKELIALDISRPYDEALIGKIVFSSGAALAPEQNRKQISVLDGTGEYSRFSISEQTEIWDRIGDPRCIKAEEIKSGDFVSIKHRFFFPVREALIISVWKHKVKRAK